MTRIAKPVSFALSAMLFAPLACAILIRAAAIVA